MMPIPLSRKFGCFSLPRVFFHCLQLNTLHPWFFHSFTRIWWQAHACDIARFACFSCAFRKPIVQDMAVGGEPTQSLKSIVETADTAVDAWHCWHACSQNTVPHTETEQLRTIRPSFFLSCQEAVKAFEVYVSSTTRTTTMLALELLAPMPRSRIEEGCEWGMNVMINEYTRCRGHVDAMRTGWRGCLEEII